MLNSDQNLPSAQMLDSDQNLASMLRAPPAADSSSDQKLRRSTDHLIEHSNTSSAEVVML